MKRKKKILFIISNFGTGGVSKSVTSLLNVIDRERYDVSLMAVSPEGPLRELLPADLRLITNPVWAALTSRAGGVWKLLKSGHPLLAAGHMARLAVSCVSKARAAEMIAWLMPSLEEEFDVAVDYNGQQQLYYMVDKVRAGKKITFFHSDYEKWPYYYRADRKYFPKADHIFTISDKCVESLRRMFPEAAGKVMMMENISSQALIERLAGEDAADMPASDGIPALLTVGHVCESKGIYWAIDAAAILMSRGVEYRWYFLGSVDKIDEYKALCREKGIGDRMHFMGVRTNPYPYIRRASVIVHPSKFEGRSIALDEAKLLCKPVVVTNFSTVGDQFEDRVNASICEMTPEAMADAVKELLTDASLRERYIENLRANCRDNSEEIEKLYTCINE